MENEKKQQDVIIIGAGTAGLSAGIYAQRNGYRTQIFEMHTIPGGVMTAWKRKGYTIDGCVQWLMGSRPGTNLYPLYEDVGMIQKREFFIPEVFLYFEDTDGHSLTFYTNIDRLEKELLEKGAEDRALIRNFCRAVRKCVGFNPPVSGSGSLVNYLFKSPAMLPRMMLLGPTMLKWTKMSMSEFASGFKSPFLSRIFHNLWQPDMTMISLLFFLAYLTAQTDSYPIGGSLPMALAMEKRYKDLGGKVRYGSRVEKILVEDGRAVGIRLKDGSEEHARYVISAADGHATLWEMLGGLYVDEHLSKIYSELKVFPSILMIGFGVKRSFNELPKATGGMVFELKKPFKIAGKPIDRLKMTIYNFDPSLAPKGKTVVKVKIDTPFEYWESLARDRKKYEAEKKRIAKEVIQRLKELFPGIDKQVEMVDVATPTTFVDYTGNWQGSYEGFLPTPHSVRVGIPNKLPGLDNFYMAGQWVRAGGGIPTGVSTGREAVMQICKADKIKFK